MRRRSIMGLGVVGMLGAALWPPAAVAGPAEGDRNCSDFGNQREAQEHFIRRGGPDRDPDGLDSDGNGVACESLRCPCSSSSGGGGDRPPTGRGQVIEARTSRVFNGDTLRVRAFGARRRYYTVRLLGVDAPGPRRCGGREATESLARLSFTHLRDSDGDGYFDGRGSRERRVRLTTDPSQPLFDRAGRLLAYVTTRRGTDFGAVQLRRGWARASSGRALEKRRRYRKAQRDARRRGRGVWSRCDGRFDRPARGAPAHDM